MVRLAKHPCSGAHLYVLAQVWKKVIGIEQCLDLSVQIGGKKPGLIFRTVVMGGESGPAGIHVAVHGEFV